MIDFHATPASHVISLISIQTNPNHAAKIIAIQRQLQSGAMAPDLSSPSADSLIVNLHFLTEKIFYRNLPDHSIILFCTARLVDLSHCPSCISIPPSRPCKKLLTIFLVY